MQNDENWDDPSIPEYTEMQKYAYVTQKAIDNSYIGYCYRDYVEIKIDSGWRFLFGDEDHDYLDNPNNSVTLDLAEILEWKPELKSILSSQIGAEFEWDNQTKSFNKI